MDKTFNHRSVLRFFARFALISALSLVIIGRSAPVKALEGADQAGALLRLRAAEFDPLLQPSPDLPMLQRWPRLAGDPGLWLIHFAGPIQDNWLNAVQANGLSIIQYVPDNAYIVWGSLNDIGELDHVVSLRWFGEYQPEYALHPDLQQMVVGQQAVQPDAKAAEDIAVVVQIAAPKGAGPDVFPILDAARAVLRPAEIFQSVQILRLLIPSDRLAWLAAQPGVIDVSPLPKYHKLDEIQGQIMAGNINAAGTGPSGTGYLNWLLSKGFSTNPEDYPLVDVTDDGIDDGDGLPQHADFYTFGEKSRKDRLIYNYNWTSDPLADGRGGHGNLNASVFGGYNNLTGGIYQDPDGYRRGLGINPFGRFGGSKVFSNTGGWGLTDSLYALVAKSYQLGARISTNSWGSWTNGMYTLDDQIYDALVRDADLTAPGNQEMILLFAAGNSGPTTGSIDSPGNAKNVITVGASENYRPHREPVEGDQCSLDVASAEQAANNLQQIADFSSRGPTDDGRVKPDLVAPGTTILGAASQAVGYSGEGICVRYYPTGQTLYAASSGTSHSTPAVAGAASLLYYHYKTRNGAPPSPAMVKAYLVNSARGLNGENAGGSLPTTAQGFGLVDLGRAFDMAQRYLVDQTELLHSPGDVFETPGRVLDLQKPLRVTLAWTDAPGSSISAAYVNDLDLEVVINGQTYLGNVFSGQVSQPGGVADFRNNVESVFLPAGLGGQFTVRVKAHNLAGDGVPGNGDQTDQDFALVIYNANVQMGTVRGVVRLQPGSAPAAGATVWATGLDGRKLLSTVDDDGGYSLALFANTYTVSAWKFGYSTAQASDVVVEGDHTVVYDFDLSPVPFRTLQGCIRDQVTSDGLAAILSIYAPAGQLLQEVQTTTEDFCFQFELPEGRYLLQANSRLHHQGVAEVNLTGDLRQDIDLVATTHEGLLFGIVTDSATLDPMASVRVSLQPGGYQQYTDGEGRFEFQLPPGEYRLTVTARFHPVIDQPGIIVRQSNQTEENFSLTSSRLEWSTTSRTPYFFQSTGQEQFQVYLENRGDGALTFNAVERDDVVPTYWQANNVEFLVSDSRQTAAASYQWLDARSGKKYYLADDAHVSEALPFPFEFYGKVYTSVLIFNDGAISFNLGYGRLPYSNFALAQFPDTLIAPFWDDFSENSGYIVVKTFGAAPHRKFVVEWFDREHWSSTEHATFEVIFYEGSNNLKFQYQDVLFRDQALDYGSSASIGLHSASAAYLQYSYNQPSIRNNTALCFQAPGSTPCNQVDLPGVNIEPAAGTLDPGETIQLTVSLIADPKSHMGLLSGGISLYTNDPLHQPYIDIPVKILLIYNGVYLPFLRLSIR